MGPRAGLDLCEKFRPRRDSIPQPSRPQRVAIPTEPSLLTLSLTSKYQSPNALYGKVTVFSAVTRFAEVRLHCVGPVRSFWMIKQRAA